MVKVPSNVLEAIVFIRDSGLTNMLAVNVVISLCHEFDLHEAGVWIGTHRSEYAQGVLEGFVADDPVQPTE